MSPARARALVAGSGAVAALAVGLGLAEVGGPGAARRDERDALRLEQIRELARALECHAEAGAVPAAPSSVAEVSPACVGSARAEVLRDPGTGAAYRVAWPEPGFVEVCADFEGSGEPAGRYPGAPPFDPATGCVTTAAGG